MLMLSCHVCDEEIKTCSLDEYDSFRRKHEGDWVTVGTVRPGEDVSGLEDEFEDDLVVSQFEARIVRFEAQLEEERSRVESLRRQLDVANQERKDLLVKVDALQKELLT